MNNQQIFKKKIMMVVDICIFQIAADNKQSIFFFITD